MVRGELLWPGAFITAISWVMIAAATMLSATVLPKVGLGWRVGGGAAVAILAPALVFAQLTVHNAVEWGWVTTFMGPVGVPEPGTWALMILGFGGVGAVIRRRRLAIPA